MLQTVSKAFFHLLAGSKTLKRIASRYGMRADGFARRFIAGESIDEAIAAAREIQASKLLVTLDYLGEGVTTLAEAASRQCHVRATRRLHIALRCRARMDSGHALSLTRPIRKISV